MSNSTLPPGPEEVQRLAEQALESIPESLRRHVEGLAIQVEEFADEETLEALGLDSPFELLGLYHGVDLPHRSVTNVVNDVDIVLLYWRPILDYWIESGEALDRVVSHVLVHEIGHHFGFSDEDMAHIEIQGAAAGEEG